MLLQSLAAKLKMLEEYVNNLPNLLSQAGVPVGTIIAWGAATPPPGKWLECNGQVISTEYSTLRTLYGDNVPDYRNRFLEGSTTPGTVIEAGLPNITGEFWHELNYGNANVGLKGAFYAAGSTSGTTSAAGGAGDGIVGFKASRSSAIYGRSNTVQPPAVTVRYFVKAG